jgi:hypothetical protein
MRGRDRRTTATVAAGVLLAAATLLGACGTAQEARPTTFDAPTVPADARSGGDTDAATPTTYPRQALESPGTPERDVFDICMRAGGLPWEVVPTTADIVDLATRAALPAISSTVPRAEVTGVAPFPTPEAWAAASTLPAEARPGAVESMRDRGFHGGVRASYLSVPVLHNVEVLRFEDGVEAANALRDKLAYKCEEASLARPMSGSATGVAGLVLGHENGSARAFFVMGDALVTLSVCGCMAGDEAVIVERWHDAIVSQLTSSPTS